MPIDLQLEQRQGRAVVQLVPAGSELEAEQASVLRESAVQPLLSTVDEPVNSWTTATHVLQAKDAGYADRVLKPLFDQPNPTFMFRFGLAAGNQTHWRGWTKHVGLKFEVAAPPDEKSGPIVTLTTVDEVWLLKKNRKLRAHRGKISRVVKAIWGEYSSEPLAGEETANVQLDEESGYYFQSYESDLDFVLGTLLPAAVSESGVSGYRLFLRGRTLHFASAASIAGELKTLAYSEGRAGVRGLRVLDRSVEMSAVGACGRVTLAYDPLRGASSVLESRTQALTKYGARRRSEANVDYDRAHIGLNLEAEERAKAQQLHEVLHGEAFRAEFEAANCPDLYVGDVLDLKVTELDRRLSSFSGLWFVARAVHTIKEGALSTVFVMTRGESQAPADRQVQDPEALTAGREAGGVEPKFEPGRGTAATKIQEAA